MKNQWQIFNAMNDLDYIVNSNTPENLTMALQTVCKEDKKFYDITEILFEDIKVHILFIIYILFYKIYNYLYSILIKKKEGISVII